MEPTTDTLPAVTLRLLHLSDLHEPIDRTECIFLGIPYRDHRPDDRYGSDRYANNLQCLQQLCSGYSSALPG